jgi:hypothetical protein
MYKLDRPVFVFLLLLTPISDACDCCCNGLGHEVTGEVVEVGRDVLYVKKV